MDNKYKHSTETRDKITKAALKRYENSFATIGKKFKGTYAILDITKGELREYREKQLVCEICENPCTTGRSLAADHDHDTNKFRGLLCVKCNMNYDWFVKNKTGILKYQSKE